MVEKSPKNRRDTPHLVAGSIIAGGTARRMGGGLKFLRPLAGRPILAHVVARAAGQVAPLFLNVNSDDPRLAEFSLPRIADTVPDAGPLGGILASLAQVTADVPAATHLLTLSADTPFYPLDLAERLAAADGDRPVTAASGGRRHAVFTLWPLALGPALEALFTAGERSVNRALDALAGETVTFPISPIDPFFNINSLEDLRQAEDLARLASRTGAEENGLA